MKKSKLVTVFCVTIFISLLFLSCTDNSTDPNVIGGDTNLNLTKVGNKIGTSFKFNGVDNYLLNTIDDSIYIAKNDNGIVTTKGRFIFSEEQFRLIDTMFGTSALPPAIKLTAIDNYLKMFGGSLDTTKKEAIRLNLEIKNKVTSEGIQGFTYSGDLSKPFTIVKYNCNVGDKYEFTTKDGKKITRTVTFKASTEDWTLGYLIVKSIRVEEPIEDPLNAVEKVTYITNHKYGLVGAIVKFKNGKSLDVTLLPLSVL